jgi:HK97 family phage major capsid protein
MIIRFLKDCPMAGRKAGETWEVQDETVARAYISEGYATQDAQTEGELFAELTRTVQASLGDLRTALNDQVAEIGRSITRGFQGATRFNPRAEPTESEDEKLVRTGGFKSIGHFAQTINRDGGHTPGLVRGDSLLGKYNLSLEKISLARAVSSPDGMYETSEPDGGALVPPDFTSEIWERIYNQEKLLARTAGYTISGNTFTIPANAETSRADGSRWGGVQGYWEGEAQQFTGSRPKFRNLQYRLKKLTVLMYATNELLTDSATALEQYIGRLAPQEIEFKILDALVNGTGAGIPLGLLKDPALITVAKDTGQAAKTITYTNIQNMYNRLWGPGRQNSVWLYNQEIEPQLWSMVLPVGTGGVPVFMPNGVGGAYYGGASSSPFSVLYGRPALCLEQCPGLGLTGDLMLVDLSQYVHISKGTIQSAMSIHLKFDYDESVFKWIWRMDGSGAWLAPLTPYKTNVSQTYSYVTALAAR